MKKYIPIILLLAACKTRQMQNPNQITTLQIVDRNGFSETISSKDRLKKFQGANFLGSQPYRKAMRLFPHDEQGRARSVITSYHDNGTIWQYLEVVSGRANGIYREWLPNGQLHLEAQVIEGIGDLHFEAQESWIFDGINRVFDETGALTAEMHYEHGVQQGTTYFYYPSGAIKQQIPFDRGVIEGRLQYFDQEGNVLGESHYERGELTGRSYFIGNAEEPKFEEKYLRGALEEGHYYSFQGEIISEIADGQGFKPSYQNGKLYEMREHRDGKPEGLVKRFAQDGILESEFMVKEGLRHGEERVFFPSGKVKLTIDWYDGEIHGMVKTYYKTGGIESQREMSHNKKQGRAFAWYRSGDLMLSEEYENDRLIKGNYMKPGEKDPASTIIKGNGEALLYDGYGTFLRRVRYENGRPQDS
ncbi:MAG: hypothetical protein ChlgKO_05860 [Chlamydiales bacterium]